MQGQIKQGGGPDSAHRPCVCHLWLRPKEPFKNIVNTALAGVAQWIEHWPANCKVTGSFPSQGNAWVGVV